MPEFIGIPQCFDSGDELPTVELKHCAAIAQLISEHKNFGTLRFCEESEWPQPGEKIDVPVPFLMEVETCEFRIGWVEEPHEDAYSWLEIHSKMLLLLQECVHSKYVYAKKYGGAVRVGHYSRMYISFRGLDVHGMDFL
jgi:hypothetical protein